MAAGAIFTGVLTAVLSVILITSVLLPTVYSANKTTWDTATVAVYAIIPLTAVFGLVYVMLGIFGIA